MLLQYFLILLLILFPLTMLSSYIIAVFLRHTQADFPYISDTGARPPESCIFGLLLNITGVIFVTLTYLRFLQILQYENKFNFQNLRLLANLSLVFGCLGGLGVMVVANFQETAVFTVHIIAAFIAFGSAGLFMAIETLIAFKTSPICVLRSIACARGIITVLFATTFVLTNVFGGLASTKFSGKSEVNWHPTDGGWDYHLVSTFSEWGMALCILLFMTSYGYEFHHTDILMELTHRPYAADIEFYNVNYRINIGKDIQKVILDNVSGIFHHGLLHCIMGPSGAGKSCFLNALAGFQTGASGKIVFNGSEYPLSRCSKIMPIVGNYVLQKDYIYPQLSIKEYLNYAAWMKLPSEVNSATERARITSVLMDRLGLDEVADRRIGHLSGGQKKRVSVALELINYPPVLFLDEPTSGLDSVSSYRLLMLLKEMTMAGCNIHQPNSKIFHMMDTLMVLAKGGRCAYQGPAEYLVNYMQLCKLPACPATDNPADFLFEEDNIEHMVEVGQTLPIELRRTEILRNDSIDKPPTPPKRSYNKKTPKIAPYVPPALKPNGFKSKNRTKPLMFDDTMLLRLCGDRAKLSTQFFVLLRRSFLIYFRDISSFVGRICAAVFCMALLAATFYGCGNDATKVYTNVAFLFFINMMTISPPVITSVMNGPEGFSVILRENINAWYNLSVYYWAKSLAEMPFQLFISWIIPVGTWFLSQQPQPAVWLTLQIMVMALVTVLSQGVGFILGIVADERSALYLPFAVILLTWLFGGYAITFSLITPVLSWIHYMVYGYASFSALLKISYLGDPALPCSFQLHPLCQKFRSGHDVLRDYEIPISSTWGEIMYLLGYTAMIFLFGWGLLMFLIYRVKHHPGHRH